MTSLTCSLNLRSFLESAANWNNLQTRSLRFPFNITRCVFSYVNPTNKKAAMSLKARFVRYKQRELEDKLARNECWIRINYFVANYSSCRSSSWRARCCPLVNVKFRQKRWQLKVHPDYWSTSLVTEKKYLLRTRLGTERHQRLRWAQAWVRARRRRATMYDNEELSPHKIPDGIGAGLLVSKSGS